MTVKTAKAQGLQAPDGGESRITPLTEAETDQVSGAGVGTYVLMTIELTARQLARLLLN